MQFLITVIIPYATPLPFNQKACTPPKKHTERKNVFPYGNIGNQNKVHRVRGVTIHVLCLGKKNPTIKRVKLSMLLMQLSYHTIYFVEILFRLILDGFESGF